MSQAVRGPSCPSTSMSYIFCTGRCIPNGLGPGRATKTATKTCPHKAVLHGWVDLPKTETFWVGMFRPLKKFPQNPSCTLEHLGTKLIEVPFGGVNKLEHAGTMGFACNGHSGATHQVATCGRFRQLTATAPGRVFGRLGLHFVMTWTLEVATEMPRLA